MSLAPYPQSIVTKTGNRPCHEYLTVTVLTIAGAFRIGMHNPFPVVSIGPDARYECWVGNLS